MIKKFIRKLHQLPRSDEERFLEWQISVGMIAMAVIVTVLAVMAVRSTFWGWLP